MDEDGLDDEGWQHLVDQFNANKPGEPSNDTQYFALQRLAEVRRRLDIRGELEQGIIAAVETGAPVAAVAAEAGLPVEEIHRISRR